MAIKLITGLKTTADIEAQDDGARIYGTISNNDRVLNVGNRFAHQIISNNLVRIKDGELLMQGRHVRQVPNTYTDLTINNGTQGLKRNDIIIARYTKNSSTGIENVELAVVEGTPGATPTDPDLTTGNIFKGCEVHEIALYRVSLDGLNIDSVTELFTELNSLENHLQAIENGGTGATTATAALSNLHGVERTTAAITYYVSTTGSDTNDGTSSGTPFKTIQHAIDILPKCLMHNITINVAAGTYNELVQISGFWGGSTLKITGASSWESARDSYHVVGFVCDYCLTYVNIIGFSDASTKPETWRWVYAKNCSYILINKCYVSSIPNGRGYDFENCRGEVSECLAYSCTAALQINMNSTIYIHDCTFAASALGVATDASHGYCMNINNFAGSAWHRQNGGFLSSGAGAFNF